MDVGSADIALLHGCNLLGQCICPWMDGSRTTQEQLSRSSEAVCRGENICHPCRLGIPAADGLEQRVSLSSVLLAKNYLSQP